MLAERSVRRLSVRAPDAALARRGAFLIEDALRTASLPGDGGELVFLRRLRLPPFAAAASPQQVAAELAAACRTAAAIDGALLGDAALAAAAAVRFADALTAHLALTRLILTGAARVAWCWPLLVSGYRPALDSGQALRAVALSLAALPEAPAALPRWLARLLTHGEGACARLLLALAPGDVAILDAACGEAVAPAPDASPQAWQAALDWSLRQLGGDDQRHLWLARMARRGGLAMATQAVSPWAAADAPPVAGKRAAAAGVAAGIDIAAASQMPDGADAAAVDRVPDRARTETTASSTTGAAAGSGDDVTAELARRKRPRSPRRPAATGSADSEPVAAGGTGDAPGLAGADRRLPQPADAAAFAARPASVPASAPATAAATVATSRPLPPPQTPRPLAAAAAAERLAGTVAGGEGTVRRQPTTAGGLLFLVPLLHGLGFAGWLAADAGRRAMAQRVLVMLLRRLPVDGDDPIWLLFGQALDPDVAADAEAARWLHDCRAHLRRRVGIGLHSLVCRPARLSLTPTHVDVWQDLQAVDLRLRRAGLDLDPGWVPWLGRVLRFHYGRDDW
jgi:hypothetical protein